MSITLPTNFPTGDRRTVRVALSTVDPLYDPRSVAPSVALPLDLAVALARQTLAAYEGKSIHDHTAMAAAATALDGMLRKLVAALDAERAA